MDSEVEKKVKKFVKNALKICPMNEEELIDYVKTKIENGELVPRKFIMTIIAKMENEEYTLKRTDNKKLKLRK